MLTNLSYNPGPSILSEETQEEIKRLASSGVLSSSIEAQSLWK